MLIICLFKFFKNKFILLF